MLKVVFLSGVLLCGGAGVAAVRQLEPDISASGMPAAAMRYIAGASSSLASLFLSRETKAERPRIAQLPQTSGVRNRGNSSLAYRKLKATASAMVEASPTARATRDAGRDAAHRNRWSKIFRTGPEEGAQAGRLSAISKRARERADQQEKFTKLLRENGYSGSVPNVPNGWKLE